MTWAKKNDPAFGVDSYGHICWLVPEHLYVMHTQMEVKKRKRSRNLVGTPPNEWWQSCENQDQRLFVVSDYWLWR